MTEMIQKKITKNMIAAISLVSILVVALFVGMTVVESLFSNKPLVFDQFVSGFFTFEIPEAFGTAIYSSLNPIDFKAPKLVVPNDVYVKSTQPTPVNFSVSAIDDIDGKVQVSCDRISGSTFKLGKTTVRCMAQDSVGNTSYAFFVVTVGYDIVKIPSWVKGVTGYWVSDQIDDQSYVKNIGYLIQQDIIRVPMPKAPNEEPGLGIPVWIKNNGKSWIDGKISDDEYSIGLQWLINRGIIKL